MPSYDEKSEELILTDGAVVESLLRALVVVVELEGTEMLTEERVEETAPPELVMLYGRLDEGLEGDTVEFVNVPDVGTELEMPAEELICPDVWVDEMMGSVDSTVVGVSVTVVEDSTPEEAELAKHGAQELAD